MAIAQCCNLFSRHRTPFLFLFVLKFLISRIKVRDLVGTAAQTGESKEVNTIRTATCGSIYRRRIITSSPLFSFLREPLFESFSLR